MIEELKHVSGALRTYALFVFVLVLAGSPGLAQTPSFVGHWRADTKLPSIVLHIAEDHGVFDGEAIVYDLQGKTVTFPISKGHVESGVLRFDVGELRCKMTLVKSGRTASLDGVTREMEVHFHFIKER